MIIKRGESWGEPGRLPDDAVVVRNDAEARHVVEEHRRENRPVPVLGLLGGDLCRTLGGRGDEARLHSADAQRFPVDLGAVLVDGRMHWFVAHLVARRSWLAGRIVAVMNAQWIGDWDMAPRSHPNDGRLDTLDADLPFGQRIRAHGRLRHGAHVPHPAIEQRRVDAAQFDLARPTAVWLDGERIGTARRLSVRVEPDAITCVV